MERLICRVCGENSLSLEGDMFSCSTCGAKFFRNENEIKISNMIQQAFEDNKDNDLGSLKYTLKKEMHSEHPNFLEVINISLAIKRINDDDVIANYCYHLSRRRSYPKEYNDYLEKLIDKELFEYEMDWIFPFIVNNCRRLEKGIITDLLKSKNKYEKYLPDLNRALKKREDEEQLFDTGKDVFICHKSDDYEEYVRPLMEMIESEGPFSCWTSERNLPWDIDNYWYGIQNAIRECKVFLFILTPSSKISDDCLKEIDFARAISKDKKVEVRIGDVEQSYKIKKYFEGIQWIDYKDSDVLLERIDSLLFVKNQESEPVSENVREVPPVIMSAPAVPAANESSRKEKLIIRIETSMKNGEFDNLSPVIDDLITEDVTSYLPYYYMLLCKYRVCSLDEINYTIVTSKTMSESNEYLKIMEYGDTEIKNRMAGLLIRLQEEFDENLRSQNYEVQKNKLIQYSSITYLNQFMYKQAKSTLLSSYAGYKDCEAIVDERDKVFADNEIAIQNKEKVKQNFIKEQALIKQKKDEYQKKTILLFTIVGLSLFALIVIFVIVISSIAENKDDRKNIDVGVQATNTEIANYKNAIKYMDEGDYYLANQYFSKSKSGYLDCDNMKIFSFFLSRIKSQKYLDYYCFENVDNLENGLLVTYILDDSTQYKKYYYSANDYYSSASEEENDLENEINFTYWGIDSVSYWKGSYSVALYSLGTFLA